MTLADMSVVTAEVKVDETDIVNVQIGQSADVTVDALPGKVFKGTVTLVGDQALLRSTGIATSQSTTGTEEAKDFKVVVTLADPSLDLRPGLSCTAKITTAHKANVLSLAHPGAHHARPGQRYCEPAKAASGRFLHAAQSRILCRACLSSKRTRTAGCAPNSFLSLPASRAPPTLKCSRDFSRGEEIVTGPYKTLRVLKGGALLKRDTSQPLALTTNGS